MDTQNTNKVLVFETNIRFKKDLERISPRLHAETRISKWNVDRDDAGRILRVETSQLCPAEIVQLVTDAGYHCKELTD